MKESVILGKSKDFALRIIKLYKYLTLTASTKEFVLSKQVLRSGTSIGANVKEGLRGQSRPDFRAKMSIALKEACETSIGWNCCMNQIILMNSRSIQL